MADKLVAEQAAEQAAEIRAVVDEAVNVRAMYTDVVRYPEKYDSAPVKLTGEAATLGDSVLVGWFVGSDYKSVVVTGNRLVDGGRVVDGDMITVYGIMAGINRINEPVVDPLIIQLRGDTPTPEECTMYGGALPGC